MSTVSVSRAIQALLGGLMGSFAEGSIVVHSTGATGLVPKHSFALPIPRGSIDETGAVFVKPNPAHPDGAWEVTNSGTSVPVAAMLGGKVGNFPSGTRYRWFPTLPGIEETSLSGAIEGGVDLETLGALKQVNAYKQLGSSADFQQFFRAKLGAYPAVSLAWESTTPLDGPMVASPGPRAARSGQARMRMRHTWILYVVTTRYDGETQRRVEGEVLRDELFGELFGRTGTRGLRISTDPGINILSSNVMQVTDTSYIDVIRFETTFTQTQRIADADKAKPWLSTRIVRPIDAETETQQEMLVPDVTVSMVAPVTDDEDDPDDEEP